MCNLIDLSKIVHRQQLINQVALLIKESIYQRYLTSPLTILYAPKDFEVLAVLQALPEFKLPPLR